MSDQLYEPQVFRHKTSSRAEALRHAREAVARTTPGKQGPEQPEFDFSLDEEDEGSE